MRTKLIPVIAAIAAAALTLSACGSSSNAGGGGGTTGATGTTSTAPAPDTGTASAAPGTGASAPGSGEASASGTAGGSAASCTLPNPVKVGVVFSLTGGAASYGATQKNGLDLAADQLNAKGGVKYTIDMQDDQTDPKQGISIFEQMVAGGDSVIIGPTLSNTAKQTNPVAQEGKVPVLGVSNTASGITSIGDYIFRNSLTEAAVVPDTIKVATAKYGLKNVVVMYSNDDAFTESSYQSMAKALKADGVNVSKTLTFSDKDTDFRSLLTDAKAQKPDALVVSALIDAAVPLVTQARQLGLTIPIIGGNGFNSPALMKGAGAAANGVVVGAAWNSAADNPENVAFLKAYKDKYNAAPDQFAAQAYTGMILVDHAVRAGCSGDRESIKTQLGELKDVPTPLGSFTITPTRDASTPVVVQIVKDGQFDVLK